MGESKRRNFTKMIDFVDTRKSKGFLYRELLAIADKVTNSGSNKVNSLNINIRMLQPFEVMQVLEVYADEEGIEVDNEWRKDAQAAFSKLKFENSMILGAFLETELVGCLNIHFLNNLYPGYCKGPYAHLETIIVKRRCRGMGVGKRLVQKAVEMCKSRSVTYIIAQTDEKNLAMRKAYSSAGMQEKYVNYHIEL